MSYAVTLSGSHDIIERARRLIMWRKWHPQRGRFRLPVLIALMVLLASIGEGMNANVQEEAGLASLRALTEHHSRPSADQLQQIESQYPNTRAAALAHFLRGVIEYEAQRYEAAIRWLSADQLQQRLRVGDHALFMLADSLARLGRLRAAEAAFARLAERYPDSIYARNALFRAAELAAEQGKIDRATSRLAFLAERKDPQALLRLARLYEKQGHHRTALNIYEEIYLDLPPSREAIEAERALQAAGVLVKGRVTLPYRRLRKRVEALYEAQAYTDVIQLHTNILRAYPQSAKDGEVQLHYGISLYHTRALRQAVNVLKTLKLTASLEAERLYYLAEGYRRRGLEAAFINVSETLVKRFPHSSWAAATLRSRGRYFLRHNRDALAIKVFRQLLALQPASSYAPEAAYRVGMAAYFRRRYEEAATVLINSLVRYPNTRYAGPALYWAARAEERRGQWDRALALFERLLIRYRYTMYGQFALARIERLRTQHPAVKPIVPDPRSPLGRALANIKPAQPPPESLTEAAVDHVQRARELRLIGLDDLALKELTVAWKRAPRSRAVSLELARLHHRQGHYLTAIRILRRVHPEYTLYQGEGVSPEVERLLFPLAYWEIIRREAEHHRLDPYLIAGLIRQESAFDEQARSRAGARGLMQLIPSTGRRVARHYGLRRVSIRRLYDPELNIRLGTLYFAQMVERFGKIEYALAAYNAGPTRVAQWLHQYPHLEIDEWIERIPLAETRFYVKAVIRNAAHYRRLYGEEGDSSASL